MDNSPASSFLEIVELPSGEIVLRRSDAEGEEVPLLTMQFSDEAKMYLQEDYLRVAKAMFDAGMQEVADITRPTASNSDMAEDRVLH